MRAPYQRHLLVAFCLLVSGCAAVTGIESKKQDNYEINSTNHVLVLDYVDKMGEEEDFLKEASLRFSACGVTVSTHTVLIINHDINISRSVVKPGIQQKIAQTQTNTILEVVPARETFQNFAKINTNYIVSVKDLNDNKLWTAKFDQHQPNMFSYAFTSNPDTALADAVVDKLASDGVLKHCPVKPAS